jgi:xanthosine utilization system XapX-like protein
MSSVLGIRFSQLPAHALPVVALVGVLALAVGGLVVYALVARCLRDTPPAHRAEILRALAELLGSLCHGHPKARGWTTRHGRSARRRRR